MISKQRFAKVLACTVSGEHSPTANPPVSCSAPRSQALRVSVAGGSPGHVAIINSMSAVALKAKGGSTPPKKWRGQSPYSRGILPIVVIHELLVDTECLRWN
jgi:hypothetical protein